MRVALAVPFDDERRLIASADHYGHSVIATCSGGDELALRLAQQPVDLAIVAATPAHLTSTLVESADLLGVRMLVVAEDAVAKRHARRMGIVDVVDGALGWELLGGGAAERADDVVLPTGSGGAGVVIAVWGPHGAPGRTSIAIALAAEFAAFGRRVVLVDADTHAAAVAPALGLLDEAPGFAAACRLAGIGGLDETQFERVAHIHHASGHPFRVLTGLGRPERWPELGDERIRAMLTASRRFCDVLVVDVAASLEQDEHLASDVVVPRRNAATLAVLRDADHVLAIGAADPVGISRLLRAHAELGEHVAPDRVVVAVNKVRSSVIGLDPAGQVRQTLARFGGVQDAALIPWDRGAFDAALLGGRALAAASPRSAARQAIRDLAERLLPGSAPSGARRRRGRRLA